MALKKSQLLRETDESHSFFRQGLGCSRHANCFTCPYKDCRMRMSKEKYGHQVLPDKIIPIGLRPKK